jgi:hypothetical protein
MFFPLFMVGMYLGHPMSRNISCFVGAFKPHTSQPFGLGSSLICPGLSHIYIHISMAYIHIVDCMGSIRFSSGYARLCEPKTPTLSARQTHHWATHSEPILILL